MYKKINRLFYILIILLPLLGGIVYANEKDAQMRPDPWDFHLSAKEQFGDPADVYNPWVGILTNENGYYLANKDSLIVPEREEEGRDLRQILVKSIFTGTDAKKILNKVYAKQLEEGESILYCDMLLLLDMDRDEYRIQRTELFTEKGRSVAIDEKESAWREAPHDSFVKNVIYFIRQYERY